LPLNPFFYFFRQSLTRATLVPAASESLSCRISFTGDKQETACDRESLQSGQSRHNKPRTSLPTFLGSFRKETSGYRQPNPNKPKQYGYCKSHQRGRIHFHSIKY
jgi:hypothetical protein